MHSFRYILQEGRSCRSNLQIHSKNEKTIRLPLSPYGLTVPGYLSYSAAPPASARSSQPPRQQSLKATVYDKILWDCRGTFCLSRWGRLQTHLWVPQHRFFASPPQPLIPHPISPHPTYLQNRHTLPSCLHNWIKTHSSKNLLFSNLPSSHEKN